MSVRIPGLGELDYELMERREQLCLRLELFSPLTLPRKKVRLEHHMDWGFGYWEQGSHHAGVPPWLPTWIHSLLATMPYVEHEYFSVTLTRDEVWIRIWLDEPVRHLERFLEALARKIERWVSGRRCSKRDLAQLARASGAEPTIDSTPIFFGPPTHRLLTLTREEAFGEDAGLFAPTND